MIKKITFICFLLLSLLINCAKYDAGFTRNNPNDVNGINWNPPTVTAMNDTTVNINDTLKITATATDNGTIKKYVWAKDGKTYKDTTDSGSYKTAWSDSGRKVLRVIAIDNDGINSSPDSCVIKVTLDPPTVTAMNDTSISINDSLKITATAMDNGAIKKYLWSKDGKTYTDTTLTGSIKLVWSDSGKKAIRVIAIDDDGILSSPDSCIVKVLLNPPTVTAMNDTTVNINDSLKITATAIDNGTIKKYVWAKDGKTYKDTTDSGSYKTAWSDSGCQVLRVIAIDNDGINSSPDSCVIKVTLDPPTVTAMNDTSISINDSLKITATATDNGTIKKYLWAKDGKTYTDTTLTGSIKLVWSDSGRKAIRVIAIDDDGILSSPDSCIVSVHLHAPVLLVSMHDSVVHQHDTLKFIPSANDTNGTIVKYLLDRGGNGWDDSSTNATTFSIANPDGGSIKVIWGAMDDDGLITKDTFTVLFNRAPTSAIVTAPTDNTAWVNYDYTTSTGNLALALKGIDPDGAADTLTYNLYMCKTGAVLAKVYSGKDTSYAASGLDSNAAYTWLLVAKDLLGDSVQDTGAFTTPGAPAQIEVSDTSIVDSVTVGFNADNDTFYVWNKGSGQLSFTISDTSSWIACSMATGVSTGSVYKQMIVVSYVTDTLSIGTYYGVINITAQGLQKRIKLTMVVKQQTWTEATSAATFSGRCGHSSVVFNNKMWIIGGYDTNFVLKNDVWYSIDGIIWTEATSAAAFSTRSNHTSVVYDDKMWVIGGNGDNDNVYHDVWYSTDGVTWTRATSSAAFGSRTSHTSVVYDSKMWVIGGNSSTTLLNDVWYSTDGITWTEATSATAFCIRHCHTSVVYNNKMWVIGGYYSSRTENKDLNDVWYSTDGVTWTAATSAVAFSARSSHTSVVYDNKICVIGGSYVGNRLNDVWYSADGVTWTEATSAAAFSTRSSHSSVIYDNKMWVIGGYNGSARINDVWYTLNQ
jgi:hypothetical protein